MNNLIRQFERESNIDVYGLGLDRVKWQASLEKFAQLIVRECAEVGSYGQGFIDSGLIKRAVLQHFGVEE